MIGRKKRILIIVLILILLFGAIFGLVYSYLKSTTDILKSDRELFYKYMSKNIDIVNVIDTNWISEYKDKIKNNSYSNKGKITFEVSSKNVEDTEESQLQTVINNTKFSFEGNTNLPEQKAYQNIKWLYSDEETELFTLKFLKEDKLYGLKSDEVVTKYVSIKNENIKELCNRLGIQDTKNVANEIIEYDFSKILNTSDKQKKSIKEKYINVLNHHIQEKSFNKEKNVRVTVDHEVYVSNKYSVKLTGDELINVKIKLLEVLLKDDNILNELVKILQMDSGYIKVIKEQIQYSIENIRKQPSNSEITFEISLYELDGKLLKTECITENRNISIINLNTGNKQNIKIEDINTNKGIIVTTYSVERNTEESNNSIAIKIDSTENGRQASLIDIQIFNEGSLKLSNSINTFIKFSIKNDAGNKKIEYEDKKQFNIKEEIEDLSENTVILNNTTIEYNKNTIQAIKDKLYQVYTEKARSIELDPEILVAEVKYAIKTMKEQFNRDEFEKQVQRSLNYVKQDAMVDIEFSKRLQKANTVLEKQKIKEERLVKRLNEFGVKASTDEDKDRILIDSGYNYNYVYYIDYDKYTITRVE